MAQGDIFKVKFNFSVWDRAFSFHHWYFEVNPQADPEEGQVCAEAMLAHYETVLVNCMANDARLESVLAWKQHLGKARAGCAISVAGQGQRSGSAAGANNALYIRLNQSFAPAAYNSGFNVGGLSETDMEGNRFTDAFLDGPVAALLTQLQIDVDAVSAAAGTWRLYVLSPTYTPPTLTIGTPMDVTSVSASARVLTQRRRQTKVIGWADEMA